MKNSRGASVGGPKTGSGLDAIPTRGVREFIVDVSYRTGGVPNKEKDRKIVLLARRLGGTPVRQEHEPRYIRLLGFGFETYMEALAFEDALTCLPKFVHEATFYEGQAKKESLIALHDPYLPVSSAGAKSRART